MLALEPRALERLSPPARLDNAAEVTGFGGVGYWVMTALPKELCKNGKLLC